MCFYKFSAPSIWRVLMAGYYMLSTLNHLCVCECVGIMPSDEPPPAWSPSSPPGHGGRVWSNQPGGGTGQNFKIEGEPNEPWPGGELGETMQEGVHHLAWCLHTHTHKGGLELRACNSQPSEPFIYWGLQIYRSTFNDISLCKKKKNATTK